MKQLLIAFALSAAPAAANVVSVPPACVGNVVWSGSSSGGVTWLAADATDPSSTFAHAHQLPRFDLTTLVPPGSTVNSVTLRVSMQVLNWGYPMHVRPLLPPGGCVQTWSGESFGLGVPCGAVVASSASLNFQGLHVLTLSTPALTNLVRQWVADPATNVGLAFVAGGDYLESWISPGSLFLDVNYTPCAAPTSYCIGAPNSVGAGARLSTVGSTRISQNDLTLVCTGVRPHATGFFFFGDAQQQTPLGNGFLCVTGSIFRLLPGQIADPFGTLVRPVDYSVGTAQNLAPGSTWNFQVTYRDVAGGGALFNLSDGLQITFCP